MSNPLVSVCIPTWNRAQALRRGLANILALDYTPVEIVISDNASADETEVVCREAARSDPRIRYVRQERNIGLYANHNFCIQASRGEFLCLFHDHDLRSPSILRAYVSFLQEHPEVGAVCSNWDLIGDDGQVLGVRDHAVPEVMPGLEYIELTLRSGRSCVGVPGAMIRRSALGDARFREDGPIGFGDFPVWFRIAEEWAIGHIPERLWSWRQHPSSQSARTIESMARDYEVNLSRYCDDYLQHRPGETRRVERWRRQIRRFLFWALAYEVGLHVRRERSPWKDADAPTLFELLPYRLTPEAFARALEQMRVYRTGGLQYLAFRTIEGLLRTNFTTPLVWATYNPTALRRWLGLS